MEEEGAVSVVAALAVAAGDDKADSVGRIKFRIELVRLQRAPVRLKVSQIQWRSSNPMSRFTEEDRERGRRAGRFRTVDSECQSRCFWLDQTVLKLVWNMMRCSEKGARQVTCSLIP
jgi:hypothetical protein